MKCRHQGCQQEASQRRYPSGKLKCRGLCARCFSTLAIRQLYPCEAKAPRRDTEPTEEELERLIAQQMRCLPRWWAAHVLDQARRAADQPRRFRIVRTAEG